MILVFLTLLIALSIVFILSGRYSSFLLISLFFATQGTQTYAVKKIVLSCMAELQSVTKLYFDIFKGTYSCFTTGLSNFINQKVFIFIFTPKVSGS